MLLKNNKSKSQNVFLKIPMKCSFWYILHFYRKMFFFFTYMQLNKYVTEHFYSQAMLAVRGKNIKFLNKVWYPPDYKTYTTSKGLNNGSAILFKNNSKHVATHTGDEQLLAITIDTSEGLITIATFYRPFNDKKTKYQNTASLI